MKGGTILLIVGLVIGYAAITGYYKCFTMLGKCLASGPEQCSCGATTASASQESGTVPGNNPKTFNEPAYEGPGPVTYNLTNPIEAFA